MKTYKCCPKCSSTKLIEEFPNDKRNKKDGKRGSCKTCYSRSRKNHVINSEKRKLRNKKYCTNNPHKLWCRTSFTKHIKRSIIPKFTVEDLHRLALKTSTCVYCGIKLDWEYGGKDGKPQINSPSLDVITPRNKTPNIREINICCFRCNAAKGDGNITDLYGYISDFYNHINNRI